MIPRDNDEIAQCRDCHSGFFYGTKHTCPITLVRNIVIPESEPIPIKTSYERTCGFCGALQLRKKPGGIVTCIECRTKRQNEYSSGYKKKNPYERVKVRRERIMLSVDEWFKKSRG